MSYYTVCVKEIRICGITWQGYKGYLTIPLRDYDVENIKALSENGEITRDSVQDWLHCNAGDFQKIVDFEADIADVLIPWQSEDNEMAYYNASFPPEE